MKNLLMAALVAALSLAAHSANAQDYAGQRYLGFNIGQAKAEYDACDSDSLDSRFGLRLVIRNCPDKDTGIKLYVGHNLHKNFAVEVGFIDYGEFKSTFVDLLTLKISGNSLFVAGMGKIQVHPKATLFGKVGLHRWDIKAEFEIDELLGGQSGKIDDDGVDLLYGIGGIFALFPNEKIKLRMEYEMFTAEESFGDRFDYDHEFISIGIVYAF